MIKQIDAQKAKNFFDNNQLFIDIREWEEYEEAHIPGSQWLALSEINEERLSEIPKDEPVVVYCRSGNRSAYLLQILKSYGYDDLYNLDGGIIAWNEQKLPVESDLMHTSAK